MWVTLPKKFKFVFVFYINCDYLKNSASSVVGRKISYVVLLSLCLLWLNVLEIAKQLSTEQTQPIPKRSLLHQLKGKDFYKLFVSMQRKLLLEIQGLKNWAEFLKSTFQVIHLCSKIVCKNELL